MSETQDAERESTGYMRLPLPVVGLGLVVLLAALLAVGLWANANLRAPALIVPTPAAAATPVTAPTAPVAAAVTPTAVAPISTPVVATATAPPQATVGPTAVAAVAATPAIVVRVETAVPSEVAAATESPTALPTVEPTLAAEVGQAYENFWRVRSQALLDLDPTHLPEVMDGNYLEGTVHRISELQNEGKAIKTQVSLSYSVLEVSAENATIVDDVIDNSVYVNIGTEDAISEPTADQLRILYTLRTVGGVWKVVDSVRSE